METIEIFSTCYSVACVLSFCFCSVSVCVYVRACMLVFANVRLRPYTYTPALHTYMLIIRQRHCEHCVPLAQRERRPHEEKTKTTESATNTCTDSYVRRVCCAHTLCMRLLRAEYGYSHLYKIVQTTNFASVCVRVHRRVCVHD